MATETPEVRERGRVRQAEGVSSAREICAVSPTNDSDLEQLRAGLRAMTDVELRKFMKTASDACDAGSDADIKHIIQLQEATAEWRRGKNPKAGNAK
jgi:hypothetical protein